MKRIIPFLLLLTILISASSLKCQDTNDNPLAKLEVDSLNYINDILLTKSYRVGVYANFREFRTNSPSVQIEDYSFEENSELKQIFLGSVKNKLYRINKKGKRKRVRKGDVWGFCDGNDIYIYWAYTTGRHYSNKIMSLGRYTYFEDEGISNGSISVGGISSPLIMPYQNEFIINLNNGGIYKLNNSLMKDIFVDDQELLSEFKDDPKKGNKYQEYISRYNQRHTEQIDPIKDFYEEK